MMSDAVLTPNARPSVVIALLPILAIVLIAFGVIGIALPVLPLHVHNGLGFGTLMVGIVAGSQFAASLLSRVWSGHASDHRGPKSAVTLGLAAAVVAGTLYFLSLQFTSAPSISVAVLLIGRAVLGGAESFIITGATLWGLARVGAQNAGKVIAWMGTAMFAAFAGGAPLGMALYTFGGFAAVAAVTAVAPLATLGFATLVSAAEPTREKRAGMLAVARKIWMPGLGAALSSVGFGVIISFGSLLFSLKGWHPVWLAFTAYAVALVIARLMFGHLPDRMGGAKVALICVFVEASGLALMGLASSAGMAAIGAALTGFGYALVFPGLGVEAVRRAPPEGCGLAMGAYTACLDLALGISAPALGLVASGMGLAAVFVISALVVLAASPIAMRLLGSVQGFHVGMR
jgi:MFS family permease